MDRNLRMLRAYLRSFARQYNCEVALEKELEWGTTWRLSHYDTGESKLFKCDQNEYDEDRFKSVCANLAQAVLGADSDSQLPISYQSVPHDAERSDGEFNRDPDEDIAILLINVVREWPEMPDPFKANTLEAAEWLVNNPTPEGLIHAQNLRNVCTDYLGPNPGVSDTYFTYMSAAEYITQRCIEAGFAEYRISFQNESATISTGNDDAYQFDITLWDTEDVGQYLELLRQLTSRLKRDDP